MTIVTYSKMLEISTKAAEQLSTEGIECEIVDLRTLRPLDMEPVLQSFMKTNRAVIVEEGWRSYGVGAEIAARIYEEAFDYIGGAPAAHHQGPSGPPSGARDARGRAASSVTPLLGSDVAVLLLASACASAPPAVDTAPSGARLVGGRAAQAQADAYYHYALAQIHARSGQLAEAIAELRLAIKEDPGAAELWLQLAQWLARHTRCPDRGRRGRAQGRRAGSPEPEGPSHAG